MSPYHPTYILGIDPGIANTGWGIITPNLFIRDYGVIKTPSQMNNRERIDQIGAEIEKIIDTYKPHVIVIEDFIYYGNRGRSTVLTPVLIEHLRTKFEDYEIIIYTNNYWKKKLVKNSTATKKQIQHYLQRKLKLNNEFWKSMDKGGHIQDSFGLCLCWLKLNYKEE